MQVKNPPVSTYRTRVGLDAMHCGGLRVLSMLIEAA